MYLYYDKTRTLKTSIIHGEPIRQNSDVNIFVCLDKDFFGTDYETARKSVLVSSVTYENGKLGADGVTSETPNLLTFKKVNSSEITYYLQQNKQYWTYQIKFDANQISSYPGKINFNLEIFYNGMRKTFANAELFVEARTGLPEYNNSIKPTQYTEIVRRLNELDVKIANIKIESEKEGVSKEYVDAEIQKLRDEFEMNLKSILEGEY